MPKPFVRGYLAMRTKALKKRGKYGRRRRMVRYKKPLALKAHSFVEKFEQTITLDNSTLDANGNLITSYGRFFKLDDIPQVASYKELFDSFIIRKIVAEIRYDYVYTNVSTVTVPSNPIYPILLIKNDHNDVDNNSYATMLESEKTRQVQLGPRKVIKHVLKPAVQVEAYKTALSSAYQPKWNCELRSVDSATPHYGLKMQVKTQPANTGLNLGKINITYRMYFSMKNAD